MYVDDLEHALHQLLFGLIEDTFDEIRAGRCSRIEVIARRDSSFTIADDGADNPIPYERMHDDHIRERSRDRVGRRCSPWTGYRGGLIIDGNAIAVNALSSRLISEIRKDGVLYRQECARGLPVSALASVPEQGTGTTITFTADRQILPEARELAFDEIVPRLRDVAYVYRGLRIALHDERTERTIELMKPRGIACLVEDLNASATTSSDVVEIRGGTDRVGVDIALQRTHDVEERIVCFANGRRTPEGGTHLDGLRAGLKRAHGSSLDGLTAVVSVQCVDPRFTMHYARLVSPEVTEIVAEAVERHHRDRHA